MLAVAADNYTRILQSHKSIRPLPGCVISVMHWSSRRGIPALCSGSWKFLRTRSAAAKDTSAHPFILILVRSQHTQLCFNNNITTRSALQLAIIQWQSRRSVRPQRACGETQSDEKIAFSAAPKVDFCLPISCSLSRWHAVTREHENCTVNWTFFFVIEMCLHKKMHLKTVG
jgi:hypothetical protein